MLSWRKDKSSRKDPAGTPEKTPVAGQKGDGPERKSRPFSAKEPQASKEGKDPKDPKDPKEPKDNAAESTGPDNRRRLGEMLVGEGIITREELDEALRRKETEGGFVGQILVDLGYIKQNELISFLVKQCKIPHISLADYHISDELLSLVPEEICLEHCLLPIDKLGKILTVAMVDPLDANALEAVRQVCPDLRIKPILCDWSHFAPACERLFQKGKGTEVTASSFGLSEHPDLMPDEESDAPEPEDAAEESADGREPADAAPETSAETDAEPGNGAASEQAEIEIAVAPSRRSGSKAAPATPAPAASVSAEEIAAQLRETMQEALRDVVSTLDKTGPAGSAAPGPDYDELARLMRESVEQGMARSTESLLKGMQDSLARTSKDNDGESAAATAQIAEALRANIEETMQRTVGELAKSLKDANPKIEIPAGPTADELARAVGESMQDALGAMARQFSEALEQEAKRSDKTQQSLVAMQETLRSSIEDTMQRTVGELAKALQDANAKNKIPAGPTADDLAKAVGKSLQDALGAMAGQFSAALECEAKRTEDTQQLLRTLQDALTGGKSSEDARTERIIEIAEAARRAAETAEKAVEAMREAQEAALADEDEEDDAVDDDNVRAFPGGSSRKVVEPGLDALDALDSPGLAARTHEQVRAARENDHPIPGYTFADFIGGKANELTVTLCRALAAGQVDDLTPFYLYGGVGLGKSHLFNAIGNTIMAENPDLRIGYVSAGMFARKFARALADDATIAFRDRYCEMDILLIDDIHLLAQKQSAQEEALYLLDAFYHEERPILLAGNAPPEKLGGLDPCLASRLFSGVVSCVRAPERTARVEILSRLARQAQADVPEDIVRLIATQIQEDMRKMTGALRKVIAYARVSGHAIDKNLAGEVLSQLGVDAA
jgi:chromosomal replication initiator protein DnaA